MVCEDGSPRETTMVGLATSSSACGDGLRDDSTSHALGSSAGTTLAEESAACTRASTGEVLSPLVTPVASVTLRRCLELAAGSGARRSTPAEAGRRSCRLARLAAAPPTVPFARCAGKADFAASRGRGAPPPPARRILATLSDGRKVGCPRTPRGLPRAPEVDACPAATATRRAARACDTATSCTRLLPPTRSERTPKPPRLWLEPLLARSSTHGYSGLLVPARGRAVEVGVLVRRLLPGGGASLRASVPGAQPALAAGARGEFHAGIM